LEPIPVRSHVPGDYRRLRLCDLDETAWDHFSAELLKECAEQIVQCVHRVGERKVFENWRLPRPPAGTRLKDLPLENRTRNCLHRLRIDDHLEQLGDRTIGEMLSIPSFGARCLVDLLTVLEHTQNAGAPRGKSQANVKSRKSRSKALTAAAERLARLDQAASVGRDDPRFACLMRSVDPAAHTALELANRLLARRQDPPDPARVADHVRQLGRRIRAMAKRTLEQEFSDIFVAPGERDAQILAACYGWEDGLRHTLAEVGQRLGITRERVRQVCAMIAKNLRSPSTIPAPTLDRTLALVAARLPCPAARLEAELVERRLTTVGMSAEAIAAGAKLLHRTIPFRVVWVNTRETRPVRSDYVRSRSSRNEGRLLIAPDQSDAIRATVRLARQEVHSQMMTTVEQIIRRNRIAAQAHGKKRSPGNEESSKPSRQRESVPSPPRELIWETLMLMKGFCSLDEATGSFCLREGGRWLRMATDKVLAVAGTVTAAQLRTALARTPRFKKRLPPPHLLLALCRQMPGVRIDGDWIIADPPRDWRKAIKGIEATIVAVLKGHGPVMERATLESLCQAEGIGRRNLGVVLCCSPAIARYGYCLYGLVKADVSSGQLPEKRSKTESRRFPV